MTVREYSPRLFSQKPVALPSSTSLRFYFLSLYSRRGDNICALLDIARTTRKRISILMTRASAVYYVKVVLLQLLNPARYLAIGIPEVE